MALFPTGIVTFLLTDIEASTRRWEQEPDAMRRAVAQHDALFERIVETHGGVNVKPRGEGDSRFSVFARASDALAAAAEFQQALTGADWPSAAPLRVRIALHSGEADVRDGDYYGSTVNRAARLRSLASGGQTLVSLAVAQLTRESLPGDLALRDLGEHRLKDLSWPEHVYQLVIPDVSNDFPPLVSLDRLTTNLPAQTTPFIGREREIRQVSDWLMDPRVRLITLTGAGGSGKTRLGLQIAASVVDRFEDGVLFVSLEAVSDPALVVPSIGQVVGARESSGISLEEDLRERLGEKSMLLVLDNFERVVGAAPQISGLLAKHPRLTFLVTSRESLRIQGEYELTVPPLELPDELEHVDPDELMNYEAVNLFVSRAKEVRPDFQLTPENSEAVAGICRRLDGLPLAIELAAARVRMFSPQALLKRLDPVLALLTGGPRDVPVRQQTLRGTIAWSYDLLTPDEQSFFRRLSIFAGGFSMDGVVAMTDPEETGLSHRGAGWSGGSAGGYQGDNLNGALETLDVIDALLNKSLIYRLRSALDVYDPRFGMLETIREFGMEELASKGELEVARRAHARYVLRLAKQAESELEGPGQGVWIDRLEEERRNLNAALICALDTQNGELGLKMTGALWPFWEVRGYFGEGRTWTEQMLALDGPPELRARTLTGAGTMAWYQGDYERASELHAEALAIYQEIGDGRGIAFAQVSLGVQAMEQGDLARARKLFDEAHGRYLETGDEPGRADVLNNLAIVAFHQDDLERASNLIEESLSIRRSLGDKHRIADALHNLGEIAQFQEDFERSVELYREGLYLRRELGALSGTAQLLASLAAVATMQGDFERGARLHGAADTLIKSTGLMIDRTEQGRYDEVIRTLQAELGADKCTALWEEGRSLSTHEAIDFALAGMELPTREEPGRGTDSGMHEELGAEVPRHMR